ncbi:hypothetical protein D9M69_572160 [compost metagenome]
MEVIWTSSPASMTALSFAMGTPATVKDSPAEKAWAATGLTSPKAWRQPSEPRAAACAPARSKREEIRDPSVVNVVSVVCPFACSAAAPPLSV